MNKSGFNGYYGCSYCTHEGTLIIGTKKVRYCKRDNGNERSNETTREDMINAHNNKTKTHGSTGVTPLMGLKTDFDVVWQVGVDEMHNLHLGVIKKMFDLFLLSKNRNEG